MISHLLFHKSLAHDSLRFHERISRYIELIEEADNEMMISSMDPYERTISIALELIIEEQMDPWDIDLKRFAYYYIRRLEAEHLIDLPIAGKLIRTVWSLLEIKSEHLLTAVTNSGMEEDPYLNEGLDDFFVDFMGEDGEDMEYLEAVVSSPEPPIKEPVRRITPKRPATLMELITALEKIKTEVVSYKKRRKMQMEMAEKYKKKMNNILKSEVYKDDINTEMMEVLDRITAINTDKPIPFINLLPRNYTMWDVLMVFISILHLAKEDVITIEQRRFPKGEIFVSLKQG